MSPPFTFNQYPSLVPPLPYLFPFYSLPLPPSQVSGEITSAPPALPLSHCGMHRYSLHITRAPFAFYLSIHLSINLVSIILIHIFIQYLSNLLLYVFYSIFAFMCPFLLSIYSSIFVSIFPLSSVYLAGYNIARWSIPSPTVTASSPPPSHPPPLAT